MEAIYTEVDLECNSPLDFDAEDTEQGSNVDEHNENEGLNDTEMLYLSKAGNEGLLAEELLSWVQREDHFRCPYSIYLHAQTGVPKLRCREKAVQWILKTQQTHDLSTVTASLAVNYVDRVLVRLSAKDLETFPLDVLPVACLSIACKMDERFEYTPEELQLFIPVFSIIPSQTVNQMEEAVLRLLDWRMSSLVPVSFVNHILCMLVPYSNTLCSTDGPCLSSDAYAKDRWLEIIKSAMGRTCRYLLLCLSDVELLTFRPSEIAVTALLNALDPAVVSAGALQTVLAAVKSCSGRIESCSEELQRLLSSSQQMSDATTRPDMLTVPSTPEQKVSMPRHVLVSPAFKENPERSTPVKSLQWDACVLRDLNAEVSRGCKRDSSGGLSISQAGDELVYRGDQQALERGVDGVSYRYSEVNAHVAKVARR
eukprot:663840-Prorocentrum_minimum.AAC.3